MWAPFTVSTFGAIRSTGRRLQLTGGCGAARQELPKRLSVPRAWFPLSFTARVVSEP